MTPVRAWRLAAGYGTAQEAVDAYCRRHRIDRATRPTREGMTLSWWRRLEAGNGRGIPTRRLDRVARFLGVGCPARLITAWPEAQLSGGAADIGVRELRPLSERVTRRAARSVRKETPSRFRAGSAPRHTAPCTPSSPPAAPAGYCRGTDHEERTGSVETPRPEEELKW